MWRSFSFTKDAKKKTYNSDSIEKQLFCSTDSSVEEPWLVAKNRSEGGDGHRGEVNTKQSTCSKVFKRLTSRFLNKSLIHKVREDKPDVINEKVVLAEDDLKSKKDSAYFSYSQSCFNDSESSALDDRLDDNISSENIASLSRNAPSSIPILQTSSLSRKPRGPHEPKKNVTLLLPNTKEKPFGIHLQTDYKDSNSPHGNISGQVRHLNHLAKCEMMEKFPSLSSTLSALISDDPRPLLLSLSSSMIGDLMFQLRTVLFSPLLLMVQSLYVVFCVIIRFLHQVSCLIQQPAENCQLQHQKWLQLLNKWEECLYSHQLKLGQPMFRCGVT